MRLGIQMLDSISTLNDLKFRNQIDILPGETSTVMFQLTNADAGMRYMPGTGSSVGIVIKSVNKAFTLTKAATQPFPQDLSIWSFNLNATETGSMAGVNMFVTLTDGASVKKAVAQSVIVVAPHSPFQC